MSGFHQWAWVMVSKRLSAPVCMHTSCMSANARESVRALAHDSEWVIISVSNTSGLLVPGRYIGGSSAGLGKAQCIDNSFRANWLSCFFLAWWEWWVARQGCLVPLRKEGMWQSSWPASLSLVGLTLWPSRLKSWLASWNGSSAQGWIRVGCWCRDVTHA